MILIFKKKFILIVFVNLFFSITTFTQNILPGAYSIPDYLPMLKNKKVVIVANQTSEIKGIHLVDTLLSLNIDIIKILSPEHGFRGVTSAGQLIEDSKDKKTGLPIGSLYGDSKKPTEDDLAEAQIVVFDIQDVGVRFYTYISTLQYVMEACAEQEIPLIVLDRPNPNGFYVDGPILKPEFKSFVGMQPVPVVYGMTIGEYANMLNGEGWLQDAVQCDLTVIPCKNYLHSSLYKLPVAPSPNLPNMKAVYLYPSIGFFEGTIISIGRGTKFPFQVLAAPFFPKYKLIIKPQSKREALKPKYLGKSCYALDLRKDVPRILENKQINISWLVQFSKYAKDRTDFFTESFNLLAGSDELQKDLIKGKSDIDIHKSWQKDIEEFKAIRSKYLLYP